MERFKPKMIYADILSRINTKDKNEVLLLEQKPEEYEKTVLIIGVFHGDEPDGEYLIDKYLHEDFKQKKQKNKLLFIPCLNPDGKAKNTRTNANSVDLNRNFPTKNWELGEKDIYFGGEKPASEVETQFLIYIIERYKPDAILSIHAPYRVVNYDGPALDIAEKISEITGYKIEENIGYPTPGSFGTYCGIEKQIPLITLELPENENREVLWNANKNVFEYFACKY